MAVESIRHIPQRREAPTRAFERAEVTGKTPTRPTEVFNRTYTDLGRRDSETGLITDYQFGSYGDRGLPSHLRPQK